MSSQYIRIVEEKTGFDPEIICTYCKQVHLTYVKVKKKQKQKNMYLAKQIKFMKLILEK